MNKKLSLEETKNYLILWKEHSNKKALETLVICNMPLVVFICKRYLNKGLSYEELESAGLEGLLRAINKFNYKEKEIEGFSTYISTAIENQIRIEFRMNNKHSNVLSLNEPIGYDNEGKEIKIEDILYVDDEEVIDTVMSSILKDTINECMNVLTRKEKTIIALRYGLDGKGKKSLREIGEIFNCSRTMISKQEQKALTKMKHPRNIKKLKDLIDS